jgi:hypothetical protein
VRETKILPQEQKYSGSETRSKESDNTSNSGATTWVEEDKTPNLGSFTGNPGVKRILSDQTEKKNSVVLSPLTNYTDRAIAAGQRS